MKNMNFITRNELATTLSPDLYTAHCEKYVYGNKVVFDFSAFIEGNTCYLYINGEEIVARTYSLFKDVNEALKLVNKTIANYLEEIRR